MDRRNFLSQIWFFFLLAASNPSTKTKFIVRSHEYDDYEDYDDDIMHITLNNQINEFDKISLFSTWRVLIDRMIFFSLSLFIFSSSTREEGKLKGATTFWFILIRSRVNLIVVISISFKNRFVGSITRR